MENCTKHYGVRLCNLHKLHRIGPDHQPSSRTPARQQHASQAAGHQPSSRPPAQQQHASPAAARQPSSRPPARQQATSPAAGHQPSSRTPARQQHASPAADHQPGSRPPARQQATSPAAMLYTRLRGRAHPLRAALMFPRAPARPRRYCVRARGLCGFRSAKVWQVCNFFWHFRSGGAEKVGVEIVEPGLMRQGFG